jgi:hypothetical protein
LFVLAALPLAARFHLREQLAAAASVLDEDYATSNLRRRDRKAWAKLE